MDSRAIALTAYRVMAWVTGIGLVVLVCIAMPIKYIGHDGRLVAVVGALHGFLYMIYVVATLVLAERCRWKPVRAVLVALAGTVPFVSFYAERKVTGWVRALPPRRRPTAEAEAALGGPAPAPSVDGPDGAADQRRDLRA